jgi:hypothetical protein
MEGSAQRDAGEVGGETVHRRWSWWWWAAVLVAWALVAVTVAAMLAAAWVYESETPVNRCWRLPRSRTDKTASGDFIGLPITLPADRKAEYSPLGYRLIYQYPDRPETYVHDVLEGTGGGDTDFIDWVWWRLTTSVQLHTSVPKAVVFFVHGHGGNGRQVKDLSIVLKSLRPSLTDDPIHHSEVPTLSFTLMPCARACVCVSHAHTDGACVGVQVAVFGAQFKGELSALQGNTLRRQAMYVNDCLKYLLNEVYPPARVRTPPPQRCQMGLAWLARRAARD